MIPRAEGCRGRISWKSEGSFSSRHRFVDTAGNVHDAIVVADRMLDDAGAVVGTSGSSGYSIDLTSFDETRRETRREVRGAKPLRSNSRKPIPPGWSSWICGR
jgi:hypothetical protein